MTAEPIHLAHAGGVPEAMMFIVPLALAVLLLRAGRRARPDDTEDQGPDEPPTG